MKWKKITLLVLMTILIFLSVKNFESHVFTAHVENFKANLDIQDLYDLAPYDDGAIISYQNGLCKIDSRGLQSWTIDVKFLRPFINIVNRRILIAERGGKNARVYRQKKLVTVIKSQMPILTAKVNKRGNVIIASNEISGYKGQVTVYARNGDEIYRWSFNDGYVTDVDMTGDNRFIILSRLSTSKSQVSTNIVFFDTMRGAVVSEVECENSVVNKIKLNRDGTVLALSDKELLGISNRGKLNWRVSFIGRGLLSYNFDSDTSIVLIFLDNKNHVSAKIYSKHGKERGIFSSEQDTQHFAVKNEVIVASESKRILRIYPNGKIKYLAYLDTDVKNVFPVKGNKIFVFDGNYIKVIKL